MEVIVCIEIDLISSFYLTTLLSYFFLSQAHKRTCARFCCSLLLFSINKIYVYFLAKNLRCVTDFKFLRSYASAIDTENGIALKMHYDHDLSILFDCVRMYKDWLSGNGRGPQVYAYLESTIDIIEHHWLFKGLPIHINTIPRQQQQQHKTTTFKITIAYCIHNHTSESIKCNCTTICAAHNIQLLTLIIDLCIKTMTIDSFMYLFDHSMFSCCIRCASFCFALFCFGLVCLKDVFRNRLGKLGALAHWQLNLDVLKSADCVLTTMTSRNIATSLDLNWFRQLATILLICQAIPIISQQRNATNKLFFNVKKGDDFTLIAIHTV